MNSMVAQIRSLPALIREMIPVLDDTVRKTLDHRLCLSVKRVYVTGCGDSHHAALTSELAFEALAGRPAEPMSALQFARYAAGYLPETGPGTNLVIGVSVSGEVARTTEALRLARQAGAGTVALTATPGSRLAKTADLVVLSTAPAFPDPPGVHTPGVRSYLASQLGLILTAVRIGEVRGHLDWGAATAVRRDLLALADAAQRTVDACDEKASALAREWRDANEFVFVGGGPNYGTALFSAGKVLEASGDGAVGQDTEEWAHLQFFARTAATPTFFITAGGRDLSRATEAAGAARTIGRRVVAVAPASAATLHEAAGHGLPLAEGVPEVFSPLLASIPGALFAAYRAEVLGEPFFRAAGGGRVPGLSRVRTSETWDQIEG
ncbi:MAG TPA: SIS domain-containing protein [Methylomirabilota bacterium]|jgi:glucosamine--fructose-6-phosphate aminotransferase (isomerizing)